MKGELILIVHNIRSAHNVGALFRTADGAGVSEVILSGYTPTPAKEGMLRLTPAEKALKKTALGAEQNLSWRKIVSLKTTLQTLREKGYTLLALEQALQSIDYRSCRPGKKVALLVGNEVLGIDKRVLKQCDGVLELPMRGKKNSLNVSVAAGIALYEIAATMEHSTDPYRL